jgi:hypothetical protein
VTGGPEGPRYTFDQEQLTDVSLDDALKDIAETAFALSTFQRQVLLFQKMTGFRNERGI